MKKIIVVVSYISYIALSLGLAYAGTQYNWANGNGGAFITPDPTTMQLGQALVVGSTIYPEIRVSSNNAVGLMVKTIAQLKAYTPTSVGQLAYCSDCVNTPVVVSSDVVVNSWEAVVLSTTGVRNDIR